MTEDFSQKNELYPLVRSAGLDNRDPNGLNKHLQFDFFNVIGEPDASVQNFELLHNASHKVYLYSKLLIYRLLTILIGLPLMLCWGLIFGSYTFAIIWLVVPTRRLCQSAIAEAGTYVQTVSDTIIVPLCRSFGQIFSDTRITLFNQHVSSTRQIQV